MVRVRYSFGSRHTGRLDNIKKQRKSFPKVMREVLLEAVNEVGDNGILGLSSV